MQKEKCARNFPSTCNVNMKKNIDLIDNVIKNRYKISIVTIIISAIIGFFFNNMSIGSWICTTDKVFSLWWTTKFFALIFSSYELFNIITKNNKKISLAGAIVLVFSGCIVWNFTKIDAIILGEIITVLFYKLLKEKDLKKNIINAIAIIGCFIGYMYTFKPFAISFGYLFFALILWILLENKKEIKENRNTKIVLIITIIMSLVLAFLSQMIFVNNYTESSQELNAGVDGLFTYLYNPILPYNSIDDVQYFGSIIAIFPLPLILALFYMYKKEKHLEFLLPISIVAVLETVYCISGFPDFIDKFTMISTVGGLRVVPAVLLANLFIIFYMMENIDDLGIKPVPSIRITLLFVCVLLFIKYPTTIAINKYLYLFAAELSVLTLSFLNYSDKRYKKVFLIMLIFFTLIGGIPVSFLNNL